MYSKWNADSLIDRYTGGEEDKIFKESGVPNPKEQKKVLQNNCNYFQTNNDFLPTFFKLLDYPIECEETIRVHYLHGGLWWLEDETICLWYEEIVILFKQSSFFRKIFFNLVGHIFCTDCWQEYLVFTISNGQVTAISCPSRGCSVQLDELTISNMIGAKKDLLEKYHRLASNAYVNVLLIYFSCF